MVSKQKLLGLLVAGGCSLLMAQSALATVWTDSYNASNGYANAGEGISTITFDDWGYTGPNGTTAKSFTVAGTAGFDATRVGQNQHVVTLRPDYLTPDPAYDIVQDLTGFPTFPNANMDGSANFYKWGYTSPGYDRPTTQAQRDAYLAGDYSSSTHVGSQFNNMQIDLDGNYSVAKENMNFGYYRDFTYLDSTDPDAVPTDYKQNINFQPYAASDATGWCGSVLADHPATTEEAIAGQLKFDFAFDVYLFGSFSSTNIAPEFEMRSYGTLDVNVWIGGELQSFSSDAVINNTSPDNTERWDVDPDYANLVSFHGAGVLPDGVWLSADSWNADGSHKTRLTLDGTEVWDFTVVPEGTEGAQFHANAFAGRAWILRADGIRLLDWYDPSYDTAAVPEPASMLLIGSGLAGLLGFSRKRRK